MFTRFFVVLKYEVSILKAINHNPTSVHYLRCIISRFAWGKLKNSGVSFWFLVAPPIVEFLVNIFSLQKSDRKQVLIVGN